MGQNKGTVYWGADPGKAGALGLLYPDDTVKFFHIPVVKIRTKTNSKLKGGKNKGMKKERTQTKVRYDIPAMCAMFRDAFAAARMEGYRLRGMIEDTHARPGNGIKQAHDFGYGKGLLQMAVAAADEDWEDVIPGQWRVAMVGRSTDKKQAMMRARRMFPKGGLGTEGKFEGPSEALLMAAFLRIKDNGGSFQRALKPSKTVIERKEKEKAKAAGSVSPPMAEPPPGVPPPKKKSTDPKPLKPLKGQKTLFEQNSEYVFGSPPPPSTRAPAKSAKPGPSATSVDKLPSLAERRARWKAQQGGK